MFELNWLKMKKVKVVTGGLLMIFLFSQPVAAYAHWSGAGTFLGFGTGLITGYLLAPKPAYVAPPPAAQLYPHVVQAPPIMLRRQPPGKLPLPKCYLLRRHPPPGIRTEGPFPRLAIKPNAGNGK